MALPRRAALALLATADIALNARDGLVSARDLAERHGLHARAFETILKDLAEARLIKGHRGPKGGYELARERRRITAADVVRAVGLSDPGEALPDTELARGVVEPTLDIGEAALMAALEALTLEQIIDRANARPKQGADFTI